MLLLLSTIKTSIVTIPESPKCCSLHRTTPSPPRACIGRGGGGAGDYKANFSIIARAGLGLLQTLVQSARLFLRACARCCSSGWWQHGDCTGDHRLSAPLTYKRERERERACVRACESARFACEAASE